MLLTLAAALAGCQGQPRPEPPITDCP